MNAINFIQQHGVEKAREVVEGAHSWADVFLIPTGEYCSICIPPDDADEFVSIDDLKRLVGSLDLVKEYGGISMAKRQCACFTNACTSVGVKPSPRLSALQQAIADYEAIYPGAEQ